MICLALGAVFSNFVTSGQFVYGKLEKPPVWPLVGRPKRLLVRHSSAHSEMLGLLCHVIVANVELRMLRQESLSRNLLSCERILLSTARAPSGTRRKSPVMSARRLSSEEKRIHEHAKTVAESLDTVRCDDCSGLLQRCRRASQVPSYRFGHSGKWVFRLHDGRQ